MPARMIIAGVLTAAAGWMTRNYAASRMQEALRIAAIRDPKGGPSVESAISLGYTGLGMIIFAAALFMAGLVVMARRMLTSGMRALRSSWRGHCDVTVPRAALRCRSNPIRVQRSSSSQSSGSTR
jgi:hypothetical protein